jgi:hypothetical protein
MQLYTLPVQAAGVTDERAIPAFNVDELASLGALQPPALYVARLSDCGQPVPIAAVLQNLGTLDGTKNLLKGFQADGLMPKVTTQGAVVLDNDSAARLDKIGAVLFGGDNGLTSYSRLICVLQRAEPEPLDRYDEIVAVHGPLHCQMEDLKQLGKPQLWGTVQQVGSIAWVLLQMGIKAVKRDAPNFHASMHFFIDVLLPAYIRAIVLRWYPAQFSALLASAKAAQETGLAACDCLAFTLLKDFLISRVTNGYVSDLLWWLLCIADERSAIRAGRAEELPRCSRMAMPYYCQLSANRYLAEEVAFQSHLLMLPPYLARAITEVRIANTTGVLGRGKGFDHVWEELVKLLKCCIGGLGGEAAKEKLLVYSKNVALLMAVDAQARRLLSKGSVREPAPAAGATTGRVARTISPVEARTELDIRRCTNFLICSGILEPAPAAGATDYRPPWIRQLPPQQSLFRLGMTAIQGKGQQLILDSLRKPSESERGVQ